MSDDPVTQSGKSDDPLTQYDKPYDPVTHSGTCKSITTELLSHCLIYVQSETAGQIAQSGNNDPKIPSQNYLLTPAAIFFCTLQTAPN